MKINQEKEIFKPITITLETQAEAQAFFDFVGRADENFAENQAEWDLLVYLSNALNNCEGVI